MVKAICVSQFDQGHNVVTLHDANSSDAEAWQHYLQSQGYDIHLSKMSVGGHSTFDRIVDEIREKLGSVDILINCPPFDWLKEIQASTNPDQSDRFESYLFSIIPIMKAVAQSIKNNWGRIVTILPPIYSY